MTHVAILALIRHTLLLNELLQDYATAIYVEQESLGFEHIQWGTVASMRIPTVGREGGSIS